MRILWHGESEPTEYRQHCKLSRPMVHVKKSKGRRQEIVRNQENERGHSDAVHTLGDMQKSLRVFKEVNVCESRASYRLQTL